MVPETQLETGTADTQIQARAYMEPLVRRQMDTPGETGQGLISALRAPADNAFPEGVKVLPPLPVGRKMMELSRKLTGAHDFSNTNPAPTFVLIKISSGDVFSYTNVFPH